MSGDEIDEQLAAEQAVRDEVQRRRIQLELDTRNK